MSPSKILNTTLFLILLLTPNSPVRSQDLKELLMPVFLEFKKQESNLGTKAVTIEKVDIDQKANTIKVVLPKAFSAIPYRNENIQALYDNIREKLPDSYQKYTVSISCNGKDLNYYVPNFFREKNFDKERNNKPYKGIPLIINENKPYSATNGLNGKHFAIWNSHGRYYDPSTNRWLWQRPKLFGIAEDTYTGSIVIPYLLPMLENAGAITLMPKERDIQTHEVIVDNDDNSNANYIVSNSPKMAWMTDSIGYSRHDSILNFDNPFKTGTFQKIKAKKSGLASVSWVPNIPSTGEYGVYVSYKTVEESVTDAHYVVHHSGGSTAFSINQTMGGSTWIYLGTFKFQKGRNFNCGRVELTNKSKGHGYVTADAVRFGGGMGNVARSASDTSSHKITSGYPRFLEAARYWLQWAGYSDSIYNSNNGKNEYKDDYMSRALWVNNLAGGSMRLPNKNGKNIPIDATIALHTDAGVSSDDEIIGSLAIHMTQNNGNYLNGTSRISSRDLADVIQTQTVNDISTLFGCNWTRRKLLDDTYYEARVPEVPTLLFELLSHQNYADMKLGLDPNFRFAVARAIYKGLLKYMSSVDDKEYVVQPLPITDFSTEFFDEGKTQVLVSWKAAIDELEPTAKPKHYILYTSKNNNGFDNGVLVEENHTIVNISPDTIYNFKVTAVNDGGESFPSEILSVAKSSENKGNVLIINGFDRVSGPASFENEEYQGFLYKIDPGVPYLADISFTGEQFEFNRKSEYMINDNPGLGASYGNYEDDIIAGNTFNYPQLHGRALLANGYSFVSCNSKAFSNGTVNTSPYLFIDLILGKQKETQIGNKTKFAVFNNDMIEKLSKYLETHGNIFVSGEYIASDIFAKDECDSLQTDFAENKLHYTWANAYNMPTGNISSRTNADLKFGKNYYFYYEPNSNRYAVTSPDVILPTNGADIALRFNNTTDACCVMYNGKDYKTIVSSIPFEAIKVPRKRKEYMQAVCDFFNKSANASQVKMVTLQAKPSLNGKGYVSNKKSYKQDFNLNHRK